MIAYKCVSIYFTSGSSVSFAFTRVKIEDGFVEFFNVNLKTYNSWPIENIAKIDVYASGV
jgi:hypothetical protein